MGARFLEMVLTSFSAVEVEINEGQLDSDDVENGFVFERHGKNKNRSFGFVRNLLATGAIASTVAHDAHNLVVIGKRREDMDLARKRGNKI